MKIFFDCEFTDLIGIKREPRLISVGAVSLDECEFYSELPDTYEIDECSDFVQDIVLPELVGGPFQMTEAECARALRDWIESFVEQVEFHSDAPQFDWMHIENLFNHYGWPANLMRVCVRVGFTEAAEAECIAEALGKVAAETGGYRHNALWDARELRAQYMVWMPHIKPSA